PQEPQVHRSVDLEPNGDETRPKTGRRRKFLKPESEWHVTENDELRIVPQALWDRVVARWKEVDGAWPRRRTTKISDGRQRMLCRGKSPAPAVGGAPLRQVWQLYRPGERQRQRLLRLSGRRTRRLWQQTARVPSGH